MSIGVRPLEVRANFTISCGEPLLVPEPVLEDLWVFGYERFGSNGIRASATLVSNHDIQLFTRYSGTARGFTASA